MNRQQAIEKATNLRVRSTVYTLTEESKPYIAPVAAAEGVEEVKEQLASPRVYSRKDFKHIGEAKRYMRSLGRGVALRLGERLPQ